MFNRKHTKTQNLKSPKRSKQFRNSSTSARITSQQIQNVYSNIIGNAVLTSPTKESNIFAIHDSIDVRSPKHMLSPLHRTKASQFSPSNAYKNKIQKRSQFSILSQKKSTAVEPKVMLPFKTPADLRSPPRKIEIYRKTKLYQKQDINELLLSKGINYLKFDNTTDHLTGKSAILSLFIFDNTDYEIHSPQEWIELGTDLQTNTKENQSTNDNKIEIIEEKNDPKCKINAKSLKTKLLHNSRTWEKCNVIGYNSDTKLYEIIWESDIKNKSIADKIQHKQRLEIVFDAEDPFVFAQRLASAHYLRRKYEAYIRYSLYIDNMPTEDVTPIGNEQINRILQSTMSSKKISMMDSSKLLQEINIEWQRTMNKIIFDKNLFTPQFKRLRESDELKGLDIDFLISDITKNERNANNKENIECGTVAMVDYNYGQQYQNFCFHSFFTRYEACAALKGVQLELLKLLDMSLLAPNCDKNVRLEDFEQLQSHKIANICNFVKRNWMQQIKSCITGALRDSGKGWFNLRERNREIYMFSKLRKLLICVNMKMEDCLRFMIDSSLTDYHQLFVDNCSANIEIVDDNMNDITVEWPSVIADRMKDCPPLFSLDLMIDNKNKCVTTLTDLQSFVDIPCNLFKKALSLLQTLPQMESAVMEPLFNKGSEIPIIKCVQFNEEHVQRMYSSMEQSLMSALKPVQMFVKLFAKYENLLKLDVDEYTHEYFSKLRANIADADDSAIDLQCVQNEISKHLLNAKQIKHEIPSSVNLGLFQLKLESIRNCISEKYKHIGNKMLALFLEFTHDQCLEVGHQFSEIKKRLQMSCKSVQDLSDMKEYINALPVVVTQLQPKIDASMDYYKMLDVFSHKLERSDFRMKWKTFGWQKCIHDQVLNVNVNMTDDKKKYYEELQQQQIKFNDEYVECQSELESFKNLFDVGKTANVAHKARGLQKKLQQLQKDSVIFNNKEAAFEVPNTDYKYLSQTQKEFDPFLMLWKTSDEWLHTFDKCMNESFENIDPYAIEKSVEQFRRSLNKCQRSPFIKSISGVLNVAQNVAKKVEDFKKYLPIIIALANDGMRERHWKALSEKLDMELKPSPEFNLRKALDEYKLDTHISVISKEGEKAAKEYQIEKALDKMEDEWRGVSFTLDAYKKTKTYRLLEVEEIMQQLDEHRVTTQAMQFSAFKGPFEERIATWDALLLLVSEVIEEWLMVQRNWLHLQPIFDSADIMKQLPAEGKKFNTVDRLWRSTMESCRKNSAVLMFADNEALLLKFRDAAKSLEQVQKGLSDYLNTKRAAFSRFYFLSDDELLQILSQTKDVRAVQPHIKKCFENITKLEFSDTNKILGMFSSKGEQFPFNTAIDPSKSQVEFWLGEVEHMMQQSLKVQLLKSHELYYSGIPRTEWMKASFGQCVMTMSQVCWTGEVEEAILKRGVSGLKEYADQMQIEMNDTVELVRGKLEKLARTNIGALIVLDVHNLNTVQKMAESAVDSINDFMWVSQMRYYIDADRDQDIMVKMVQACFPYGYEYQGNSFRLVITPLTERCYMTLMSALQLHLGGAPAGPAGTGKTETVKDLAKNVAKQCVVFNCSDSLDHLAMGKFFKGLATSGAWACFDEFNRIDIEVLSVVAQQISSIWNAIKTKKESFIFEETEIKLNDTCSIFITMNPGYAGRTPLPDNLVALFRPVAMMVPDYALIAEISLYSYGFNEARKLSTKMAATFRLCSEQLSAQDHYDYGMRAVKSVIVQAGNLKKKFPNKDEEVILLRALCDANVPKFLSQDLILFNGIISDLFPGQSREDTDYGLLMDSLLKQIDKHNLQREREFLLKVLQLYDVMSVRHGLMLVGPTGGGKTCALHVLKDAICALDGISDFHKVKLYTLNPKAVTMGELYGEFDSITHEWTDGLVPTLVRECCADTSLDRKWICFDGVVDTLWIESMNTVLDDNKKLCLTSGEIISLTDQMNMIFEVEDLSVASPATVSRCGMIYFDPTSLGLQPMITSWLNSVHEIFSTARKTFATLFDLLLQSCIDFIRNHCLEPVPSVDNNLVRSLMNIIDCVLAPFIQSEDIDDDDRLPEQLIRAINNSADSIFIFAIVWSVGATVNQCGRIKFDAFLKMNIENLGLNCNNLHMKNDGILVYDFTFNLKTQEWMPWMNIAPKLSFEPNTPFADIIVPTQDSVRYTYFLDLLMKKDMHVVLTGDTGTGKTVNVQQYLSTTNAAKYQPLVMMFSAATTAKLVQNTLDERLDTKRRQCVYGPPLGTRCVLFVDDMNMPQREIFGAQPPIEFLRQWLDHTGWYKRVPFHTFCSVLDIVMIGAMGPPGGGRNPISNRFLRHFNQIAHTELASESLFGIFNTILSGKMVSFNEDIQQAIKSIVQSTISVYFKVCECLLPTPSKSHYTFNLRDLASVHQGLLQCASKDMETIDSFLRLWIHENRRVFGDRLINDEDRQWFDELLAEKMEENFSELDIKWSEIVPNPNERRLIFADFIGGAGEDKKYNEVQDIQKLTAVVNEFLEEYNADVGSSMPMNLVLFADAIEHICRISRVLSLPQGNALLLGVGGSGRQSLTNLASYIGEFHLFRIEIAKNYGANEWREDLKTVLMQAGIDEKPTVFLFSDNQIVMESFVEDINNILNSGDVPGLWIKEDLDRITEVCRIECVKRKIEPTKLNIYQQFINRVRTNLHMVICMSPMGEDFRTRLRMFPALVNCCTIDWFKPWPADALTAVAHQKLSEDSDLKLSDDFLESVVNMFVFIHQTVEKKADEYADILGRYTYVTPTSYLELLKTFKLLHKWKKNEVSEVRDKLDNGVKKLESAGKDVAELKIKLTEMQPILKITQKEVEEMMITITADKEKAAAEEAIVSKQESEASEKAQECSDIKADAEADLAKALPALKAATSCLKQLKKADVDEVRAFRNPPSGVRLTMEVACQVLKVPPIRKKDPQTLKKYDDYWEAAQKSLLSDTKRFLETLVAFDKDSMTEKIIKKIDPYIANPAFAVDEIEKASKACRAICMWSHAMHTYYYVAKDVEPKRLKLAKASATLEIVQKDLMAANARLKKVMDRLAELQAKFDAAVAEKDRLANEVKMCSVKLERAEKLIGGLGGEKIRWTETVIELNEKLNNVTGDVVLASGAIAYVGAFTAEYRLALYDEWRMQLLSCKLPHTANCDVVSTCGKPVDIRNWTLCGLPTDTLSVENAIILDVAERWPLMIDPQGQATRFIKKLAETEATNGYDIVKISDGKAFTRALENAIRFGKWVILENIFETLDPQLEPVLQRAVFPLKGQLHIKLGDNTIPYNDQFRLYMTTKLPNPHYPPELQVKVTLLNFTVTPTGLQDQMLGLVVAKEAPELEAKKNELVVSSAAMKKQLEEIEDKILKLLKDAQGDILEDENLITVLSDSKAMAKEINKKVKEQEVVEVEIDDARAGYAPVAFRASTLYFCVSDLAPIDPMYQFSLQWFVSLFETGIDNAPSASELEWRLQSINDYFTLMLYQNVCRSLFEKHKLLFSFLLTVNILKGDGKIDADEYRHFVQVGHVPKSGRTPNPTIIETNGDTDDYWLDENTWKKVLALENLPIFDGFIASFCDNLEIMKKYYDAVLPHSQPLPETWDTKLVEFQKLLILRSLRPDKMDAALQDFIQHNLGQQFIEPPPFELSSTYEISTPSTPLIFILSSGADPYQDLLKFAEEQGETDKLLSISLGMGQGPIAERYIQQAVEHGGWVVLQNCHLCISWLPQLEKICEDLYSRGDDINPNFRLWLTSMPTKKFPVSVLQRGVKMTNEPPKGLRANLLRSYLGFSDEFLNTSSKPAAFKKILFGLCMYHALILDRRKYGPLGWNIPYSFRESDLRVCIQQLHDFIDMFDEIPFKVIHFLIYDINYGGRVTDNTDRRTSKIILDDFITPEILKIGYNFSASGKYSTIEPTNKAGYLEYIRSLDLVPEPEIFGFHDNANITFATEESDHMFNIISGILPRTSGGTGKTKDEIVQETAISIEQRCPSIINIESLMKQYPTTYEESMNTVLVQEAIRYNRLLFVMQKSLKDLQKAIKGEMVMTTELETMGNSLFDNIVPNNWESVAYPSMKPLAAWVTDLIQRMQFLQSWIKNGTPKVFWISGFFFPQAFLTGTLQNFSRKHVKPIDTISFDFRVMRESEAELLARENGPEDGCYISGLFLEGCRWNADKWCLDESKPKELFVEMPVIWLIPKENHVRPEIGIYKCPVYKILTRRGTLSTTGHSTNFVMFIDLPSNDEEKKWVKAGVAMFCGLKY